MIFSRPFKSGDASTLKSLDKSLAVIHFDMEGRILEANGNFLATMGYGLEEIRGQHHRIFMPATEVESEDYRRFWERLREGRHDTQEYRRIAKGGREVWIQASYNPVLDKRGRPVKVVKYAADITRQKNLSAEYAGQIAAIEKSQAVIHFSLDGTIIDANDNFLNAMGYSRDEICGRHHSMFVDPVEAQGDAYRSFWEKLRRGEFQACEYRRLGRDGREVWIQASYNPILDSCGRPSKVVKFATDITARKLAQADSGGQLAAIDRAQAVIHFDLDGRITDVNENFLATVGYTRDEVVGRHHSMFIDPEYARSEEYARFWEGLRAGNFDMREYRRLGKGGREVWIQASYNPIFDMNGKPFKVVKYATNITARTAARQEVAHLVTDSLTSVQGLAAAAEQMSASIAEISKNMSMSKAAVDDIAGKATGAEAAAQELLDNATAWRRSSALSATSPTR